MIGLFISGRNIIGILDTNQTAPAILYPSGFNMTRMENNFSYFCLPGIDTVVIPGKCREQRKRALDLISQYNRTIRMYMCTGKLLHESQNV